MGNQASSTEVIGKRYILKNPIGSGSMGLVYHAVDRLTGRDVALKRVRISAEQLEFSSRSNKMDAQLTLAQEFKILASLRHPNIISVLDYGFEEDRKPYVAMELLSEAEPITQLARLSTYDEKILLLMQMLQAMAYLHRRNVLHRDIKPRNVLVMPAKDEIGQQVKLLDFGLSIMREAAREGEIAGTPSYMAPEMWVGKPATKASDLYALGVIAFELFANQRPFMSTSIRGLYAQVRDELPDLELMQAGPEVRMLVGRLLAKAPEDRFADASDVIIEVQRLGHVPMPSETAATRESFLQAASFVGREVEFGVLTRAFEMAKHGRGSALLVAGESGVGKSRLLEELRTLALVDGALVLRGIADREARAPYDVWREPLRWLCMVSYVELHEASVLKAVVPDIHKIIGREVPDAPVLSTVAEQVRLFDTVETLLRRQPDPVVIVLEDLHWAGAENLGLLNYLRRVVHDLRLLIVGSYRDDDYPIMPAQLPGVEVVTLKRLDSSETAQLVEAMLGLRGQTSALLELLQRETEGNAFFLVEMVRALAEEAGQLEQVGTGPLPEHLLTGGVQGIVKRRLSRVPKSARRLLRLAAVAGRVLDLDVLREALIAEGQPFELDMMLRECADAAVLDVEDGDWRFAHNKLRDGVVDDLLDYERRDAHEHIAAAMESVYQYSTRPTAAALAYHWGEAGNIEKEENYTAVAGEQALRKGAYESASGFLKRALELQTTLNHPKRKSVAIMLQLGNAYQAQHRLAEANELYEAALALGREISYEWGVASSLNYLGEVASENGLYRQAAVHFLDSLRVAMEIRAQPIALAVLTGLAELLASGGGDQNMAAEFASLVLHHPATDGSTHYNAQKVIEKLRAKLTPEALESAMEVGRNQSIREVTGRILDKDKDKS